MFSSSPANDNFQNPVAKKDPRPVPGMSSVLLCYKEKIEGIGVGWFVFFSFAMGKFI